MQKIYTLVQARDVLLQIDFKSIAVRGLHNGCPIF